MKSPEPCSTSIPKHLKIGFLISLMALCTKHLKRITKKIKTAPNSSPYHHHASRSFEFPTKSPLRELMKPKNLFTNLNKATNLAHRKKKGGDRGGDEEEERFGDGGVWQRSILMGDRCQPLDFPGVIYYDSCGKRLDEVPARSPRASPLPGYLAAAERKVEV